MRAVGRTEDSAVTDAAEDQVFELRQYTLRGGQRDALISLFERAFIEGQNELGAHIVGTFRDLDDPDRFVWIRGFRDMTSRQAALSAFYEGPIWAAHRTAANSTMLDSDNVLLLRPSESGAGFGSPPAAAADVPGVIGATIHYLGAVGAPEFTRFFEELLMPQLIRAGAHPIARLVSETRPNSYTRLPIRERDRAFVWFARWPSIAAEESFISQFRSLSGWRDSAPETVLPALVQKPERLRLAPTMQSLLR
jgi:hypothetical protein